VPFRFFNERRLKRQDRQFLRGETGYHLSRSPVVIYDDSGMEPVTSIVSKDGNIEARGLPEILSIYRALHVAVRMARRFKPPPSYEAWLRQHAATAEPPNPTEPEP
jgi:hypothetical protein